MTPTIDWDQALDELRHEYVREAAAQTAALAELVDELAPGTPDRSRLDQLRRGFHGFAGSGQTYGYPGVTAVGREGEALCVAADEAGVVSPATLAEWHRLLAALGTEWDGSGDAMPRNPGARPAPRPDEAPLDALVVDDDPAVTRLLARRLALEGFASRTAGTVAESQARIAERLPDVLIADVMLPDGTGYEVVENVRRAPGGEQTVVLVISVRTAFVDRVEAIHSGADAYFEKPVDWDALVGRVHYLVSSRQIAQARVLSVEDDPQQAAFLRSVLASGGYEVRTCADPVGFETELSVFHPDLVVMDVLLPGICGYDLVRYLRQDERYATTPVIVLTAGTRSDARLEATRAGADDFLLKPVAPGQLLATVSARIERARFLQALIERDGLTRLLTHSAFMERVRAAAARAERCPRSSPIWAMIDLDRFKTINDRYGHPTGDRVLVALAQLLRRRLRQSDVVGRYGGEEFAVLIEGLDRGDAERLFDRLRADFEALLHRSGGGDSFSSTFSAGLAAWDPAGDTVDAWRQRADDALYQAKRAGRNRVMAR